MLLTMYIFYEKQYMIYCDHIDVLSIYHPIISLRGPATVKNLVKINILSVLIVVALQKDINGHKTVCNITHNLVG